jgi:spore coat protein U-like protein
MRLRLFHAAVTPLFGLAFLAPSPAKAACAPLSLCSCTATATGVSFGSYDPTATQATTTTGSVQVHCTLLVAIAGSFSIDLSTGSSNSYSGRTLRNGASKLNYNLFTNNTRSQIWGNGTGGSANVSQTFSGLLIVDQSVNIYGSIGAGQNVPDGSYSDTIIATINY